MRCPICGSYESSSLAMKSEQFSEELVQCSLCESSWSIAHGLEKVFIDTQSSSFLEGVCECVEADDYPWAVYSQAI